MTLRLSDMATALPPRIALQGDVAEMSPLFAGADERQSRVLKGLYRRTHVERRHSVVLFSDDGGLEERCSFYPPSTGPDDGGPSTFTRMQRYGCEAPTLARQASAGALEAAGVEPEAITHLVTVSCTGFSAPGFDLQLVDDLGLDRGVARTHVGFMGCHGALNGLRTAAAYSADPDARVLLCAVELCSLHLGYGWDPEMLVANALFADGAAAAVGWRATDGEGANSWCLEASGSYVMPDSADAMTWHIGDHGFRMTLSPRIPELIKVHLEGWLRGWLGRHGLTPGDVGSWAVHPGGPRILRAVEHALALPSDALRVSWETLRDYGNMSSPTILFILDRLRREKAAMPCVAVAFGPGLTVEAALFTGG